MSYIFGGNVAGGGDIAAHEAASNPHPVYLTQAEADLIYSSLAAFVESVDDRIAALLVAGTNVILTYNDVAGSLTIDATGGSGGLSHSQILTRALGA